MGTEKYLQIPADLPIPIDDGRADHLPGFSLPSIRLLATDGSTVDLSELRGRTVLYCYPKTAAPDGELPEDWDSIPGARGCTPQACSFRDHHAELSALNARVFGLSTQTSDYQREAAQRLHLPFRLLSDHELVFAKALNLPAFKPDQEVLISRITLIINDGSIEHLFYPVFPPDQNANEVIVWLKSTI